jgi:uncharacterized protein YxeA
MNEENLQVILAYLDKITAKLGIGIQQVWPWFIKQQYVDAFVSLGFFLITIIIAAILLFTTFKLWRKESKYSKGTYYYNSEEESVKKTENQICAYSIYHQNHESTWVWTNIFCLVMVFSAGIIFYTQFFDIFNPEYSAFKDIAKMLPSSLAK